MKGLKVVSGQVGQLDSGKQLRISCSDLSSGFTSLRFRCGSEALFFGRLRPCDTLKKIEKEVYDYRTGQEGVGGLLCPGSTLQALHIACIQLAALFEVSLVGRQSSNASSAWAPAVALVSGSDCGCAARRAA